MKYRNRIMTIIALVALAPSAYSGSLTDSIAAGDTLTATLLNNAKTAINDNDSRATALEAADGVINDRATALEAADGVINGRATALEAANGVINGKVTALEAADGDMNVRVSILEGQPKAKVGFGDPSDSTDPFITGSEIGTVYIDIVPEDAYMAVAIVSDIAIWKRLTPKKYAIGDVGPAGGWVFYVTADGLHGLEAAPVDQASETWGCYGSGFAGAASTTIGSGARNTDDIIRGCPQAGIAARIADDYTSPSGYVDWFLPSKDELNEMYLNIGPGSTTIGNVGGFASSSYWSSSEIDVFFAWFQSFDDGGQLDFDKDLPLGVRAVRAF